MFAPRFIYNCLCKEKIIDPLDYQFSDFEQFTDSHQKIMSNLTDKQFFIEAYKDIETISAIIKPYLDKTYWYLTCCKNPVICIFTTDEELMTILKLQGK